MAESNLNQEQPTISEIKLNKPISITLIAPWDNNVFNVTPLYKIHYPDAKKMVPTYDIKKELFDGIELNILVTHLNDISECIVCKEIVSFNPKNLEGREIYIPLSMINNQKNKYIIECVDKIYSIKNIITKDDEYYNGEEYNKDSVFSLEVSLKQNAFLAGYDFQISLDQKEILLDENQILEINNTIQNNIDKMNRQRIKEENKYRSLLEELNKKNKIISENENKKKEEIDAAKKAHEKTINKKIEAAKKVVEILDFDNTLNKIIDIITKENEKIPKEQIINKTELKKIKSYIEKYTTNIKDAVSKISNGKINKPSDDNNNPKNNQKPDNN